MSLRDVTIIESMRLLDEIKNDASTVSLRILAYLSVIEIRKLIDRKEYTQAHESTLLLVETLAILAQRDDG